MVLMSNYLLMMKNFIKKIMGLSLTIFMITSSAKAQDVMAILSDNLMPVSTNYVIYPEASNLISQEISNRINMNAHIKALPVCNSISNAQKQAIDKDILRFTKEYQYTYNLNYTILRKISSKLGANYILLVTSGLDVQSEFLKETIWNRLSIGGENAVNPSYKVITHITLIDPKNELILMQKNYDNLLRGNNFDLAIPTFSPSPIQLKKMQKVSTSIANNVSPIIETKIMPELIPTQNAFIEKVNFHKKQAKINVKPISTKETANPETLILKQNPKVKLYNYIEGNL